MSPRAVRLENMRTGPCEATAATPCPFASRRAYTVSEPKLQPRCPTAGTAIYGSSPPGLWYDGANRVTRPEEGANRQSLPAAASTNDPSRRGPTTSSGRLTWTSGVHRAGGRAAFSVRAAAPPQPTARMPATGTAIQRLANDKEYAL